LRSVVFGNRARREIWDSKHEWQFQRFLYEYLGIELSIPLPEAERIFGITPLTVISCRVPIK
jgi:hypothetical protein